MAVWNNGTWNSGLLWGPAAQPAPPFNPNLNKPKKMKRQAYFPTTQSAQPEWFNNLADQIDAYAPAHGLSAGVVTEMKADCGYCAYAVGAWMTEVRNFGPAATAALETLYTGSGAAADASMFGGIIHFTFSIPTGQTGADGAPGEVSTLQLNAAVNTCAQNPAGVQPLNVATATLADVIAKVNELVAALLRI
jgi:hypothetical protein